jgi:hypothetical protein
MSSLLSKRQVHVHARDSNSPLSHCLKIKEIFHICKVIQKGTGAKSYMRKGFLLHDEMHIYLTIYMRAALVLFDFAPNPV